MNWKLLGFNKNIYFCDPLQINADGKKLLLGREIEINTYISEILGEKRSIKIISDDVGVGKTSFINICQYICYRPQINGELDIEKNQLILPSFRSIQINNDDNYESFTYKITKVLSNNIYNYYRENELDIPDELLDHLEYWIKIKKQVSTTSGSLGATFLGSGGQFSKQSATYSFQELRDPIYAFDFILQIFLKYSGYDGVFLLIDNLDIVDSNQIVNILDEIRDDFLIKENVHWILIGNRELGNNLNVRSRRLRGFFTGTQIRLNRLSNKAFLTAIDTRSRMFSINDPEMIKEITSQKNKIRKKRYHLEYTNNYKFMTPLDEKSHLMIYEFAHFELRETFRIYTDLTFRAFQYIILYDQLSIDDTFRYLFEFCEEETSELIMKPKDKKILSKLYLKGFVSNYNYKIFGYKSASGFDTLLRSYSKQGYLLLKEDNKNYQYEISWKLEALAMTGKLNKKATDLSTKKHYSQWTEVIDS